jgi:hypothetical protein
MSEPKYYKSKAIPLKRSISTGQLLANRGITKYFLLPTHQAFIDLIDTSVAKDFYEYIPAQQPVPFFFDIEIYRGNSEYFETPKIIIDACISHVRDLFVNTNTDNLPQYRFKTIILESHSESKRSFHIIIRVTEQEQEVLFANVGQLKELYKQFGLDAYRDTNNKYLVDPSVYREGLFRTIHSSKTGEVRPLVKCEWSDDFSDIDTLITWHNELFTIYDPQDLPEIEVIEPEEIIVNVPEELSTNDIQTIKRFVQREFHHYPNRIRDVFIDKQYNCIIVALNERYCPIADREHRGNNQYVVIDTTSAKQKCHDTECNNEKYMEITLDKFPIEVNEVNQEMSES